MEISSGKYTWQARYGRQIPLDRLGALASALAGRRVTVRWGDWGRDMGALTDGHWNSDDSEIVLRRSLGTDTDWRKLEDVFLHELGHCVRKHRSGVDLGTRAEREAEEFKERVLRRVGPGFVWWLMGMTD